MGKILLLFLLLRIIVSAQTNSNVILSEIMFKPQPGENEFIELYNTSDNEKVDLSGYKIKYQTSSRDSIVSAGSGIILQPKSFAVIFQGKYDIANGIYKDLVPSNALVLKISDNSFGSTGMSNSSDRMISLLSPEDDTLETYTYTADNDYGISDEKMDLTNDDSQNNWSNSKRKDGTPGFNNSVTPLEYDLAFGSISITPLSPRRNDDVNISAIIKNIGSVPVSDYSIEIFDDLNKDSSGSASELIYKNNLLNLAAKDSLIITTSINSVQEGEHNLVLKIIYENDENQNNNSEYFSFNVYANAVKYNDLIINEIMYAPQKGEPEWIELFNKSETAVNIKDWSLSDARSSIKIIDTDKILEENDYLIISEDSSIFNFYSISSEVIITNLPSLNNIGDAVVIKDPSGYLIDSLNYLPSWGGNLNGSSLERVSVNDSSSSKENWRTCQSKFKATPGENNSVSKKGYDLAIKFAAPEQNHVIAGTSFKTDITVKNNGYNRSLNFIIKTFNDINKDSLGQENELIKQITGNSLNRDDSSIIQISTGSISMGKNYFIGLLETEKDEDMENNISYLTVDGIEINEIRNDIVINEIMYAPSNGEPEWIELYNRSNKIINLKNYSLADEKDTVRIIEKSVLLNPKEFFIISDDSTILDYYDVTSKYQINNFPTLNNSGDKVILLDSLNRVIDSLEYFYSWGGNNGKSLERIDAENSSTDSSNWGISKVRGTPGAINSVTQKDFDIFVKEIIFSPQNPVLHDSAAILVKILNIGKYNAGFKIKLFEDTNLDSIPNVFIKESDSFYLTPGDSVIIPMNYLINNLQTKRGFYLTAVFPKDQDTTNNSIYSTIEPGIS